MLEPGSVGRYGRTLYIYSPARMATVLS